MDQQTFAQLLGNYGEFVGAIAVLMTLGYLAVQIRHNTNSNRSASRQTLLEGWSIANWDLANDPELLRIYANAIMHWPDLPVDEKARFDMGMGRWLANLQNGILLRDAGMLDDTTLDTTANFMLLCILSDGGSKWWEQTSLAWPETRAYLEARLSHGDNLPPPAQEMFPDWMAMVDQRR
jgi:hypothetical protein